jgi:pyruvate, water dikinase
LSFEVTTVVPSDLEHPRTAIMVNLGNPELAFATAMLPNDGVGLARMEFIISEHIGIHPLALTDPAKVTSRIERATIARLVCGYAKPTDFFVEKLSEGIGMIAAAFYPKPVVVRLSDFKTNEYASLIGGKDFEPVEGESHAGASAARLAMRTRPTQRALHWNARHCGACAIAWESRTCALWSLSVAASRRPIESSAPWPEHGLQQGENGLEIWVMCEIPNNVIQIDAFAQMFDGFSIGSNDLTQLTLGVDRDSDVVAFDFDERDPGVLEMLRLAVSGAKRNSRHVGICGEAPANYPDIAEFLTGLGIDSISVNPASLLRTIEVVRQAELLGEPLSQDQKPAA